MTRVNSHIEDQTSPINGTVVGVLTAVALVLAGFLSMASFAAI
jgi:hypothetical protein